MSVKKISIEEISKMSLDDYISAAGIKGRAPDKNKRNRNNNKSFEPMDSDPSIPNALSKQWRLIDPNRPAGQPPLIPLNARQSPYYQVNFKYRNRRYSDRDKPNNSNENHQRQNFKRNMRQNAIFEAGLRNVMQVTDPCTAMMPMQNNALVAMNKISENIAGMVAPLLANHGSYDSMFSALMEKWEERKTRKQKYDMAVQKEISEYLGKPLYFSCNSGGSLTVVTKDGDGLNDCQVKATATDTSMNQRFA